MLLTDVPDTDGILTVKRENKAKAAK